jgi:predicted GIY-YIG superfamily endonuclease
MIKTLRQFFKPDPVIRDWSLYVITKGNKYYVGITSYKDVRRRIRQHGTRKGSAWMLKFKHEPTRIVEVKKLGRISRSQAEKYENDLTHKYMNEHGKRNVRGGYNVRTGWMLMRQYNPGSIQDILQIFGLSITMGALILFVVSR